MSSGSGPDTGIVLTERQTAVRRALGETLPWVAVLPDEDVDQLLAELITVAQDGTSLEDLTHIAVLLTQWRNTAEVHADPVLLDHVGRAPSGDFGPASPHLG